MTNKHPLRLERELRGWSQAKLAQLLGTSSLSISRWERETASPSPYFREKLCELFEKDAQTLGFFIEESVEEHVEKHPVFDPFIPVQGFLPEGLVGREKLIASLVQQICSGEPASTITLHGLPGVGKTALLLALTQRKEIQNYFSDGILWAGPGPQPHLLEHLQRWGSLFDLPQNEMNSLQDLSAWAKDLRTHIGGRKILIILDDIWSLEDALVLQVGGIQCVHLVTTRSPKIATQLSFRNTVLVPGLSRKQGNELLARFLPDFSKQEPEALDQVVQEVGMLPLALTLIGKHLYSYERLKQPRRIKNVLKQLHEPVSRLQVKQPQSIIDHHPSISPDQPLSLETTIRVSYQQLSLKEKKMLQALAVLPVKSNSFSEETALAVTHQSVKELDALYDAGLLEIYSPGRYTLHQTIADYARMQAASIESLVSHKKNGPEGEDTFFNPLIQVS